MALLKLGFITAEIGIDRQVLVNVSHIEFEENLTNGMGVDTRPQTDRQTDRQTEGQIWSLHKAFFFNL
jgi:hypothetical protein